MRTFLFSCLLLAFLALPAFVQAGEPLDMAKISCKDFLSSKEDELGLMLMWIDGYMSATSDNTVMSEKWMKHMSSHVATYCKTNPSHTLMQAIESTPEGDTSGGHDLSKMTCKELVGSKENEIGMMITWMDGYMSAKSSNTVLSDEWIEKLSSHIGGYCKSNPGNTIMQAMDAMPAAN